MNYSFAHAPPCPFVLRFCFVVQNEMLDDVRVAVEELHQTSITIGQTIAVGAALTGEVGKGLDKTKGTLQKSNGRLQEMLDQVTNAVFGLALGSACPLPQ